MKLYETSIGQIAMNLTLGCMAVLLYAADAVPPSIFSVALFLLVFLIFIKDGFHGRVFSFAGAIFCILPLLHVIGFVVSDTYAFYPTYEISLADQLNSELRNRLSLMGLVTICGLLAGAKVGAPSRRVAVSSIDPEVNSSFLRIIVLGAVSIILMYLDAPEDTIFTSAYTESLSLSSANKLGSLFPLAFGLNAIGWYLYFNLGESYERRVSLYFLVLVTLANVVFFDLLRGHRQFLGFVICFFFLLDRYTAIHKRAFLILSTSILAFVVMQFVGVYRSIAATGVGLLEGFNMFLSGGDFFHGTWTAVLLTPLATLGDFHLGNREYLYGKTYLDFLLSIPPTPVADFFGYIRPITAEQGPAWEVSYGVGGTYISVVPFFNFSMPGVLAQTFLVGFLLGTIDRKSYENSATWVIFAFSIGVVLWGVFWYGEMYLLRAVVTTFPILLFVWYALGLQKKQRK